MRHTITVAALAAVILLPACAGTGTGGATSTPISTQGAQTVGGDQGQAQATETGSAVNHIRPLSVNLFGLNKATVRINTEDEEAPIVRVDAEGDGSGTFNMHEATFGTKIGDRSANPSVSSGGGAAGGTGSAARGATTSTPGDQSAATTTGDADATVERPPAPTPPAPPVLPEPPTPVIEPVPEGP